MPSDDHGESPSNEPSDDTPPATIAATRRRPAATGRARGTHRREPPAPEGGLQEQEDPDQRRRRPDGDRALSRPASARRRRGPRRGTRAGTRSRRAAARRRPRPSPTRARRRSPRRRRLRETSSRWMIAAATARSRTSATSPSRTCSPSGVSISRFLMLGQAVPKLGVPQTTTSKTFCSSKRQPTSRPDSRVGGRPADVAGLDADALGAWPGRPGPRASAPRAALRRAMSATPSISRSAPRTSSALRRRTSRSWP